LYAASTRASARSCRPAGSAETQVASLFTS
jgi:hypothetical protein